ncbi:MAG: DUF2189 domain-containing protein [Hyphomonas sp.]|uniref:DUF2189 domain-containing protein n=1 Tax=Hyphomonas sp. TaxID=87 RepID=UPI0035296498
MDEVAPAATTRLPDVSTIGVGAPFRWLAGAFSDFRKAPGPCLIYGAILVAASVGLAVALYYAGALRWLFAAAAGFFLVAPMLAMGLYRAGWMLEKGEKPGIGDILIVKSAFRAELLYLGLALFVIYSIWVEAAHLIYGLSTHKFHKTLPAFVNFMLNEKDGHAMVMTGTLVGGFLAFLAFSVVAVSAPMLLTQKTGVFVAAITSVRTIAANFLPMLVWAFLIVALTLAGIATGFLGLILTFPLIGLASWRAYRDLVPGSSADLA